MKQVQIDNKIIIEVDEHISDERAKKEYLEKLSRPVASAKIPYKKIHINSKT